MKAIDVRRAAEMLRFLEDVEEMESSFNTNQTLRLGLCATEENGFAVIEDPEMMRRVLLFVKRTVQTELVDILGVDLSSQGG